MFKKIRNKIESQRNSNDFFWDFLIKVKDVIWKLSVWISNPKKLPVDEATWNNSIKIYRQPFKGVLKTKIFKSNSQAETEIHSLVSHKHVFMYLLAIKSLLRFYDDVAIVVHSDNSLSRRDKKILKYHIKDISIIEKNFEDKEINKLLKSKKESQRYRATFRNGKQLFDFVLLSKTGKIVALDSDTLFLNRPDELIDWMIDGKKEIRFLYEENPSAQQEVFSQLGYGDQLNLCCGFLCFYKEVVDLELIEKLLVKIKKPDWHTGQNIYAILVKNKLGSYKVSHFNSDKYQSPTDINFFAHKSDSAVFRHYWSSVGLGEQYLIDAKGVIDSLI